jgi:hypothetical protein
MNGYIPDQISEFVIILSNILALKKIFTFIDWFIHRRTGFFRIELISSNIPFADRVPSRQMQSNNISKNPTVRRAAFLPYLFGFHRVLDTDAFWTHNNQRLQQKFCRI